MTAETRFKLAIAALLALVLVSGALTIASSAPITYTTKGRIVLSCDGVQLTEHVVETEASERIVNYALEHGGKASCVLKYPDKTVVVDIPASPPVPPPATGSATLSWTPPTRNTNGTTLTNLAGFRIVYGATANALVSTIQVPNPALTTYVVENLPPGTWFFAMRAYSTSGAESENTNVVSKSLP